MVSKRRTIDACKRRVAGHASLRNGTKPTFITRRPDRCAGACRLFNRCRGKATTPEGRGGRRLRVNSAVHETERPSRVKPDRPSVKKDCPRFRASPSDRGARLVTVHFQAHAPVSVRSRLLFYPFDSNARALHHIGLFVLAKKLRRNSSDLSNSRGCYVNGPGSAVTRRAGEIVATKESRRKAIVGRGLLGAGRVTRHGPPLGRDA